MKIVRFKTRLPNQGTQPVTIGLPLPATLAHRTEQLTLVIADGSQVLADFDALAHWPDNSIRWVLCSFLATGGNGQQIEYALTFTQNRTSDDSGPLTIESDEKASQLTISDNRYSVFFEQGQQSAFPILERDGARLASPVSDLVWLDATKQPLQLISRELSNVVSRTLSCCFTVNSVFKTSTGNNLNLALRYKYVHSGVLEIDVEIHNPQRAQHKRGIWDLGDPGSILFSSLALSLGSTAETCCDIRCEQGADWTAVDHDALLFQASSGGAQWDSINHCDSSGVVRNQYKGYKLSVGNDKKSAGLRADPVVRISTEQQSTYSISMPEFWQNFPSAISYSESALSLELFPQAHGYPYELQGGEKKTQKIILTMADTDNDLAWTHAPAAITLNPEDVIATKVLRYCAAHDNNNPYDKLLQLSLCEQSGIKANREVIDEYGWRNFGEIYADHEALYHTGDEPFVSHYNNQYDPIASFGRQFLLTGDARWYSLMHDLARHVIDIDLYHTDNDRPEYNHGLFWHTDHYVKACTSSHRTYSRHHYAEDWNGPKGGGPGPEHCYTTGLGLYYSLSGDQRAKDAMINLQAWITRYYEGNGSLTNFIYLLLKKDSKTLIDIARGKRPLRYLYPLNRGVGNYIRSLMDCYEVSTDYSYISRVEHIIQNTIGPGDDISLRNLDDLEYTWYYTVFLQEVIRYLDTKRRLNEFDESFIYARESMLHYAQWMVTEELPYLARSEQLEHANHTWVAQDIRKACILYAAYRYSLADREPYRERAIYFRDYVIDAMQNEPTAGFARIQMLLMQNHGPHSLMDKPAESYSMPMLAACPAVESLYSPISFAKCLTGRLIKAIKSSRPGKELAWIKPRVT